MDCPQDFPEVYKICQQFMLTEDQMQQVVSRLTQEIELGLRRDTHLRSTVKSYITRVQELPTGKERGKFLVLDLGGSNIGITLVYIKSETDVDQTTKSYDLIENLIHCSGQRLFAFLAKCLAEFCMELNVAMENLPLAFTFSFPCEVNAVGNAVLVQWKKEFSCPGVEGRNVIALLQRAINNRSDIKVRVITQINDSTAALLTCAFENPNCRIGLIIGHGTNASYLEKTKNTEMLNDCDRSPKENMIVNTEWSTFGDNGEMDFIRTPFDKIVAEQSPDPNCSIFEKFVSGVYMGELVRLILLELMERKIIFKNRRSQSLTKMHVFDMRYITVIESDQPGETRHTAMILNRMGITTVDEKDLACVQYICQAITARSAMLIACGIAALVKKMNVTDLSVGVDGGVYRYHPHYHKTIIDNFNQLLPNSANLNLVLCERGTALGAALQASFYTCKC